MDERLALSDKEKTRSKKKGKKSKENRLSLPLTKLHERGNENEGTDSGRSLNSTAEWDDEPQEGAKTKIIMSGPKNDYYI